MSLTIMFAGLAGAVAPHSISMEYHGRQIGVTYVARAEIVSRTVGARTPNRADSQRCQWTATILVDRKLDHGPALARSIATGRQFSGSEAGACVPGNDPAARGLAPQRDEIEAHLRAVAQADRAPLLAELDAVRHLASG